MTWWVRNGGVHDIRHSVASILYNSGATYEQIGQVLGHSTPQAKGTSGNLAGRPKGCLNKTTVLTQSLLQKDAKKIVAKVLTMALEGDHTAIKLVFPRLCPAPRTPAVVFDLPDTSTIDGLADAIDAVLAGVARGQLSPEQGRDLVGLLDTRRKVAETCDIERRLANLESLIHVGRRT